MNDNSPITIPDYGSTMNSASIQNPFQNYTPKTVLVIGNGFDLSLKMKTSYHDFAGSKFWPFSDKEKYRRNRQTLWGDGVRMLTQNCC